MPFTFAHPAAVLPLRRFGDLSALVIGSLVPDAGYLLMVEIPRELTHGLGALWTFCLPAGLLAYLLYHRLLREPLLALAPDAVCQRMDESSALPGSLRAWLRVTISLLIGSATHIAWDEFTHLKPWFEATWPATAGTWLSLRGRDVDWHFALRHGSAVLGLGVIVMWAGWAYRHTTPCRDVSHRLRSRTTQWLQLALLCGVVLALAAGLTLLEPDLYAGHGRAGRGARIGVGVLSASLLTYALCWQAWRRWPRR